MFRGPAFGFGWVPGKYGVRFADRRQQMGRDLERRLSYREHVSAVHRAPCQVKTGSRAAPLVFPKSEPPGEGGGEPAVGSVGVFTISGEQTNTVTTAEGVTVIKLQHMRGAVGSRTVSGEPQETYPPYSGEIVAGKVAETPDVWVELGTRVWRHPPA